MNPFTKYEDERVKVTCVDGQVLTGRVGDVFDADDNDPPKNSIVLDLFSGGYPTEVFEDEIKLIEIL